MERKIHRLLKRFSGCLTILLNILTNRLHKSFKRFGKKSRFVQLIAEALALLKKDLQEGASGLRFWSHSLDRFWVQYTEMCL